MAAVVSIDSLLQQHRLWRGQAVPVGLRSAQPTGLAALDAVLPGGGWPEAALVELLLPADGLGELRLLLPTLARLTQAGRPVVWVDPPYRPYAPALAAAGVDLRQLQIIDGAGREAPWAIEQCLRSRACGAVLGWSGRVTTEQAAQRRSEGGRSCASCARGTCTSMCSAGSAAAVVAQSATDKMLRRWQVAAETGQALAFLFRPMRAQHNPSPAALRLQLGPGQLRVLKCRGGLPPARPIVLAWP